ncbi:MAG: copper chaperone PCu(A)C [Anaerolineales bacterium]|nr:copper chaperone PCu(A)C [Anaerolineales bacterium]
MKMKLMSVFVYLLLLSACGAKEGIEVRDAWARTSTEGMNSAVYFVIQNHNAEADELIGAASDVADAVEIHESKMEGDVMTMNRVESIVLEPSAKVEFMPGGFHVMLIGLKQDLKAGDEIEVTLQFRNGPDITVKATVKDGSGMQNMGGHSP